MCLHNELPPLLHLQDAVHQDSVGGEASQRGRRQRWPDGVLRLSLQDPRRRGDEASALPACVPPGLRRPVAGALLPAADVPALPPPRRRRRGGRRRGRARRAPARRRPRHLVLLPLRRRFLAWLIRIHPSCCLHEQFALFLKKKGKKTLLFSPFLLPAYEMKWPISTCPGGRAKRHGRIQSSK